MNPAPIHSQALLSSTMAGRPADPELRRRILQERAAALASEVHRPKAGGQLELIEFLLAHERYGIESSYVREVFPLKDFTPIPGTPPFILGVINVRSQIVSVTDIRKVFNLPESGITDLNKVIILHDEQMEFGLLADRILAVRCVDPESLSPRLTILAGNREHYVKGITNDGTIVLDAGELLADPDLVIQELAET